MILLRVMLITLVYNKFPLESIIRSVGRYEDFTRSFLPKSESNEERWVRVPEQIERNGVSSIEVSKLGDVRFVKDGNHRVSVTRQLGYSTVPAKVTDVAVRASPSRGDDTDAFFVKPVMPGFSLKQI